MNEQRIQLIRERLTEQLEPSYLEIIDESDLHAGHAGAQDGRGHFRVQISSPKFEGLRPIQCHRLVYEAVGDLMQSDIHALSIDVM